MKTWRWLVWFASLLLLAGCRQFDALPYLPTQTPQTWLEIQPYIELSLASRSVILVQPSTSAIVYFLGILTTAFGLYFLRIRGPEKARLWWGIALILWGIGALLAGTSYEAFSYQIKCAGREVCIWTSAWEVAYLILSVASIDAMMVAQAYACAAGKWRKALMLYASLNLAGYLLAVLIGSIAPVKFLISFELLILVAAPTILIFLLLNGRRYARLRQAKDRVLLGTWIGLIASIAAYFLYLISGATQTLWARGIWFSENDVLHIGLILWMLYIARVTAHRIQDEPALA